MSGDHLTLMEGRLHLYRRENSRYWQCSTYLGGRNHRATTKEENLAVAKAYAVDWYAERCVEDKQRRRGVRLSPEMTSDAVSPERRPKLKAKGPTFREVGDKFLAEYQVMTQGQRSPKYVETLQHKLTKHLNPFFGDKAISEVTESTIQDYRVMRANTKDKEGKPKPPARTTIHHEIIAVRHVLKTAKRHGWIAHVPDLSAPYKASGKISHRAWFSLEEYRTLWKATQKRARKPPNPKWKWECQQFHDFVLFVANTGLRPDEVARLEFRDVVIVDDDATGERILEIEVRGKRGVGYCKSMPGAVRPFERLRDRKRSMPKALPELTRDRRGDEKGRRPYGTEPQRQRGRGGVSRGHGDNLALPGPKDLLFAGISPREQMNAVLDELDLKIDRDGQRRTAYSLRHTYICLRLMEGADIYQVAKNCRTSVEMIEKYYAAHIKNTIDASAINVRKLKKSAADALAEVEATR
jgi:integrase